MDSRNFKAALIAFLSLIILTIPLRAKADTITVIPVLRHITVDGDENKFREDNWRNVGWAGGAEEFEASYMMDEETSMHAEGHALFGEQDYDLRVNIERQGLGRIRTGYTEYRKYFDDTGGFFPHFSPRVFPLGRDLELDTGHIFLDARLTITGWPEIGAGYEHRFRDGEKSLLKWGGVTLGETTRNIFPAYEEIDETVDIWTAEISHTVRQFTVENSFRYEHYSRDSIRYEEETDLTAGTSEQATVFQEGNHDALFNTFYLERAFPRSLYFSLGYLYSNLDGDAGFRMQTVPFNEPFDKNWSADVSDIDRKFHIVNLNAMAGPYHDLAFYGGLQGELTDTNADASAVLEGITFGGDVEAPVAGIRTREDSEGLTENIGVRYSGISRTTVYAEGEFRQNNIDLDEQEIQDNILEFERMTETRIRRERYTIGLNTSPFSRTTFTALYRKSFRKNDYDHDRDSIDGYSAFITEQEFDTDEFSARISWRPIRWLKGMMEYKRLDTNIDTSTDTDPPGDILAGNYTADIYSLSFLLTPRPRLYLSCLFSYRDIRSRAFDNGAASIIPYDGDSFTSVNSLNYIIDEKTKIRTEYSFSGTGNFHDNSTDGLPLLHDYRLHRLAATLSRKISDGMEAKIRYGFFDYEEGAGNDTEDYSAHLIGIAWEFKL